MKTRASLAVLLTALALCGASAAATTFQDWEDGVTLAADYLLQFQNDDGAFPWKLTNPDPTTFDPTGDSPGNTLGATARGLVAAYTATGESRFLDAANDVADLIEYRYDNQVSVGGYAPPFFNKDVEFAYELAAAGGKDITAKASASAIDYFNAKFNEQGGANAAEAVYSRYVTSGWATAGAQFWMLGNWAHVGALLGDTEVYAGYTGDDLADDLYTLMADDFGAGAYFDPETDVYAGIGEYGVLEAAFFSTGGAGSTDVLDRIHDKLMDPASYYGFQDLGYVTYLLDLMGDSNAAIGRNTLLDWLNEDGGWVYSNGAWYVEGQGEALLGMANNAPVPEPLTMLTVCGGAAALGGYVRKRRVA